MPLMKNDGSFAGYEGEFKIDSDTVKVELNTQVVTPRTAQDKPTFSLFLLHLERKDEKASSTIYMDSNSLLMLADALKRVCGADTSAKDSTNSCVTQLYKVTVSSGSKTVTDQTPTVWTDIEVTCNGSEVVIRTVEGGQPEYRCCCLVLQKALATQLADAARTMATATKLADPAIAAALEAIKTLFK